MIEAWVDGSVRNGNPGIGATSAVVKRDGMVIFELSSLINRSVTNNEAEYLAVIVTIESLIRSKNMEDCIIYTDSSLVYGQMVLGWKINFAHLIKLHKKLTSLCNKATFKIDIKLISRWDNCRANDIAQGVSLREKERINGV